MSDRPKIVPDYIVEAVGALLRPVYDELKKYILPIFLDRRILLLLFFALEVFLFQWKPVLGFITEHALIKKLEGTQAGIFLVSLFTAPLAYFIWSFRHVDYKDAHELKTRELGLRGRELRNAEMKLQRGTVKYMGEQSALFEEAKRILYACEEESYVKAVGILQGLLENKEIFTVDKAVEVLFRELLGPNGHWVNMESKIFDSMRDDWNAKMSTWRVDFSNYHNKPTKHLRDKISGLLMQVTRGSFKSNVVIRNSYLLKFIEKKLVSMNHLFVIAEDYFLSEYHGQAARIFEDLRQAELCSFTGENEWRGETIFKDCSFIGSKQLFRGARYYNCFFFRNEIILEGMIIGENSIFTECKIIAGDIKALGINKSLFFQCSIEAIILGGLESDCQFENCFVIDEGGNNLRMLNFDDELKRREKNLKDIEKRLT